MVLWALAHSNAFLLVCRLQYPSLEGHDFRPTWNGGRCCGFCTRNGGIRYFGGFVSWSQYASLDVGPLLTGDAYRVQGLSDCLSCILVIYFFSRNIRISYVQFFAIHLRDGQSGAGLPISYATEELSWLL